MPIFDVAKKITAIPGTALAEAQDAVIEALGEIYDQADWHFQKASSGWLCPGQLFNNGTTTTTPYSADVICDEALTAELLAYASMPLITQLQYRNPSYSIYDIIAYDNGQTVGQGNYPFATLTLNRPWMEPASGPGQPYMIYQVYFVAPVLYFSKFVDIRDTTDNYPINFWSRTQMMLAEDDSQRTVWSDPEFCVPAGIDMRPNSSTPGWQRFELWPHQLSYVPYSFDYRARGPYPQSATDWLTFLPPYPITEEMLTWRAKDVIYMQREAERDRGTERGKGANWIILSQMATKKYAGLFDKALALNLNIDGEQMTRVPTRNLSTGPYATMNGRLNLGSFPEN